MNDEEKKRFDMLKKWIDDGCDTSEITFCTLGNLACLVKIIERQQSELENKDKIIDLISELMYEHLNDFEWWETGIDNESKEDVKQYFENKVKEGNKNEK